MARPTKHPRTGIYQFRQRVPEDVRKIVGRGEVTRSLGTKNLAEAKVLHARVVEEFALRWTNLRLGRQNATHKSIQALAGEFYREYVEAHDENPGEDKHLQDQLTRDLNAIASTRSRPGVLFARFMDDADAFLAKHGLVLSIADHARFVTAISRARSQAVAHTLAKARGDYRPDPDAVRFPPLISYKLDGSILIEARPFEEYWTKYADKRELAEKTKRKFYPILSGLFARIGTTDVSAVREEHLLTWRDHLEENTNLSANSVKDGYLAAAKAFFGWMHTKEYIAANPCLGVRTDSKNSAVKMRGFSDFEATRILAATLAPGSKLLSPENAAARRWIPWICAYTGARVNEVTQLRKKDLFRTYDIWAIITPDAGTVKDGNIRYVPLHSHLVEQGFVEYVNSRKDGPLFYAESRKRKSGGRPQYETVGAKLAEWIRDLGIDDPTVYPNHGWRHRVKTLRRRYGMDKEITDALQGHAPLTEGDGYGESEVPAMYREIMKIPAYEVVATACTDRRRKGAALARDGAGTP